MKKKFFFEKKEKSSFLHLFIRAWETVNRHKVTLRKGSSRWWRRDHLVFAAHGVFPPDSCSSTQLLTVTFLLTLWKNTSLVFLAFSWEERETSHHKIQIKPMDETLSMWRIHPVLSRYVISFHSYSSQVQWDRGFHFLQETRNWVTYPEPHRLVSDKGRFHYKYLDSTSHPLSPKSKWCVSHRGYRLQGDPKRGWGGSSCAFLNQQPTHLDCTERRCFPGPRSSVPIEHTPFSFNTAPEQHPFTEKKVTPPCPTHLSAIKGGCQLQVQFSFFPENQVLL